MKKKDESLYTKVTHEDTVWQEPSSGLLKRGDMALSIQETEVLKHQASMLLQNIAWKQIIIDTRYDLQKMALEDSQTLQDLYFNRACLAVLKTIEIKTQNLARINVKKN